jgi:hypothetical protein
LVFASLGFCVLPFFFILGRLVMLSPTSIFGSCCWNKRQSRGQRAGINGINWRKLSKYYTLLIVMKGSFDRKWKESLWNDQRIDQSAKDKLLFKTQFCFEKYLSEIYSPTLRLSLSKFGINCHDLAIERGRYRNSALRNECVHVITRPLRMKSTSS